MRDVNATPKQIAAVLVVLFAFVAAVLGWQHYDEKREQQAKEARRLAEQEALERARASIPQKLCPVLEEEIDPEISIEYEGRKVYFCCDPCQGRFKREPAKYLAKLDPKGASGEPEAGT